jgi:hypothetical protein
LFKGSKVLRLSLGASSPNQHFVQEIDLKYVLPSVYSLLFVIETKYPNAKHEWGWQFVFSDTKNPTEPRSGT